MLNFGASKPRVKGGPGPPEPPPGSSPERSHKKNADIFADLIVRLTRRIHCGEEAR